MNTCPTDDFSSKIYNYCYTLNQKRIWIEDPRCTQYSEFVRFFHVRFESYLLDKIVLILSNSEEPILWHTGIFNPNIL